MSNDPRKVPPSVAKQIKNYDPTNRDHVVKAYRIMNKEVEKVKRKQAESRRKWGSAKGPKPGSGKPGKSGLW